MTTVADVSDRMLLSGDDLSAGTIQWGQRQDHGPPIALTPRDLRLMALIHDVNYLSSSQLTMLGWGFSGERAAQKRLKRLYDSGYLDRFRPIPQVGTAEWIYQLATTGWTTLLQQGIVPQDRPYVPAAITSISYTEHDLQLAALILHIAQTAARDPTRGLIDTMPFLWRGPRNGRIDTDTPEPIRRSPAALLPEGTRLHPQDSRGGYLEPDATLIGHAGQDRWAVLIEYDRTDRPHKQTDRLRRYDHWLNDGWRHTHFATHTAPPSVIFLTAREQPLRRLIETADKTYTAWYGHEHAGPREGTHPARQRTVFTSRERILKGDWRMHRTPNLPPALRDDPTTCTPRTIEYNLPTLFPSPS